MSDNLSPDTHQSMNLFIKSMTKENLPKNEVYRRLDEIFKLSANINETDEHKQTPLMVAVMEGDFAAFEWLFDTEKHVNQTIDYMVKDEDENIATTYAVRYADNAEPLNEKEGDKYVMGSPSARRAILEKLCGFHKKVYPLNVYISAAMSKNEFFFAVNGIANVSNFLNKMQEDVKKRYELVRAMYLLFKKNNESHAFHVNADFMKKSPKAAASLLIYITENNLDFSIITNSLGYFPEENNLYRYLVSSRITEDKKVNYFALSLDAASESFSEIKCFDEPLSNVINAFFAPEQKTDQQSLTEADIKRIMMKQIGTQLANQMFPKMNEQLIAAKNPLILKILPVLWLNSQFDAGVALHYFKEALVLVKDKQLIMFERIARYARENPIAKEVVKYINEDASIADFKKFYNNRNVFVFGAKGSDIDSRDRVDYADYIFTKYAAIKPGEALSDGDKERWRTYIEIVYQFYPKTHLAHIDKLAPLFLNGISVFMDAFPAEVRTQLVSHFMPELKAQIVKTAANFKQGAINKEDVDRVLKIVAKMKELNILSDVEMKDLIASLFSEFYKCALASNKAELFTQVCDILKSQPFADQVDHVRMIKIIDAIFSSSSDFSLSMENLQMLYGLITASNIKYAELTENTRIHLLNFICGMGDVEKFKVYLQIKLKHPKNVNPETRLPYGVPEYPTADADGRQRIMNIYTVIEAFEKYGHVLNDNQKTDKISKMDTRDLETIRQYFSDTKHQEFFDVNYPAENH